MQPKRQSPFDAPRIVGYVPADKAAQVGAATPIPILLYLWVVMPILGHFCALLGVFSPRLLVRDWLPQ